MLRNGGSGDGDRAGGFRGGCFGAGRNDRQGQFELAIESNLLVDLNFDSNGEITLSTTPNNFGCFISRNADGTYSLVVGPVVTG